MRMMTLGFAVFAGAIGLAAPVGSWAAPAQPAASPAAVAPPQSGQAEATVNVPLQLFGVPVQVAAPDPVSYTGSAYRNDVSGQSESNSDPAIAEQSRDNDAELPDAW